MDDASQRYARQMRLPRFGVEGQERLRASRVLVVGCGALGTVVSEQLCRAGVGMLSIVDRDIVEWSNLQRQTLFTEVDARRSLPKAEAAKSRLTAVNSEVRVRAFVDDLGVGNARGYAAECDIIVDCLDNFETRFVLNDCAVERGVPLVYGGAVGLRGMAAGLLPWPTPRGGDATDSSRLLWWDERAATPCLCCIAPEPPAPGEVETCDTAGVLGSAASIAASIESAIVLRMLSEGTGGGAPMAGTLLRFDLGASDGAPLSMQASDLRGARDPACACCAMRRFVHLAPYADGGLTGAMPGSARILCGRTSVEIHLGPALTPLEVERLERRLAASGAVSREAAGSTVVLRLVADPSSADAKGAVRGLAVLASQQATLAIVEGTTDPELARSLVARLVGV